MNLILTQQIPLLLLSMHSVTLESEESKNQVIPVLKSLSKIPKNIKIIATYPNNDAGGRSIIKQFKAFDREHKNFAVVPSLGRRRFHGMLGLNKIMDVTMIGNSSAGVKETPIFKCPSINIGSRQQGRLRSTNIIDAGYNQKEILSAIKSPLIRTLDALADIAKIHTVKVGQVK